MIGTREQLKDRIQARKHEMLAKYNDLKADTRAEANVQRERLKRRLDVLEEQLKGDWEKMSDAVLAKVDKWLDEDRE